MSEETLKFMLGLLSIWGGILSTILAIIKIWEVRYKDRPRFATAYAFTDMPGEPNTITIANLSSLPVQVSHWALAWHPRRFQWNPGKVMDVTPEDRGWQFSIKGHDSHTIEFSDDEKFEWGHRAASGRDLILTLSIFGQRRPIKLKVYTA